jgi:hypothetical protein
MSTTNRVLHATREQWTKELSDQTLETHALLKLIKERKNVKYVTGTKMKWTVKFKELDLTPYSDMEALAFSRNTLTKTAELDWRGYKMADAISEQEMAENMGGDTQIIDLFADKLRQMQDDANSRLCRQFYVDGNATGNEKKFHGIESFCSANAAGQTAGDAFATTLNDTYAGLSTAKGAYDSDSTSRGYDFWSPVVVSTNATGETWATKAIEQLRRGITETRRTMQKDHRLDLIVCNRANYRAVLDLLDDKERLVVNQANSIARFGFSDTIQVDGCDITIDPDIPSQDATPDTIRAYGFNTAQMELCILKNRNGKKDQLWNASGDAFREDNMSFRFWIGLYGNLKFFSPRHFAKFVDLV